MTQHNKDATRYTFPDGTTLDFGNRDPQECLDAFAKWKASSKHNTSATDDELERILDELNGTATPSNSRSICASSITNGFSRITIRGGIEMQRTIKFRVWWDKSRNPNGLESEMKYLGSSLDDWDDGETPIMQFTGLKDKNGVEIYEGDILKAKHDDGQYDIGEVVYGSKGAFCLYLPKVATGIKTPLLNYIHGMMFAESDFRVIGNIYENPELLEGEV